MPNLQEGTWPTVDAICFLFSTGFKGRSMEPVVFRGEGKRIKKEIETGWSIVGFVPSGILWPLFTTVLFEVCVNFERRTHLQTRSYSDSSSIIGRSFD
jgi:hypothetical protein